MNRTDTASLLVGAARSRDGDAHIPQRIWPEFLNTKYTGIARAPA